MKQQNRKDIQDIYDQLKYQIHKITGKKSKNDEGAHRRIGRFKWQQKYNYIPCNK